MLLSKKDCGEGKRDYKKSLQQRFELCRQGFWKLCNPNATAIKTSSATSNLTAVIHNIKSRQCVSIVILKSYKS